MPPDTGQWPRAATPGSGDRALVVSADPARAEALVPILVQSGLEVHQVARVRQAERMILGLPFRLVVLVEPVPSVGRLLERVRSRTSPSRRAGVILVASSQELARVERMPARPNHTVRFDRLQVEGRLRVTDLLHVAPRAGVQAWIRLSWRLGQSSQRDLAETVNLSTSGMLIRGCGVIPVGTEVDFDLVSSTEQPPIIGRAEVVRHSRHGAAAVATMGLRILRLEDGGRVRLARLVARAGPEEDGDRTKDAWDEDDGAVTVVDDADSNRSEPTPPLVWVRPGASLHRAVESIYEGVPDDEPEEDA